VGLHIQYQGDRSVHRIVVLENRIQEYAWGSKTFIPEFLGKSSPARKPEAEMWMGSHPRAPSMVLHDGNRMSLAEFIRTDPQGILGRGTAERFHNKLPFLFKVISAASPLSIQAHPGKEQAEAGFLRENMHKIPLDSPERIYRDDNHKPELICALEPFWALKGFREVEDILEITANLGISEERFCIDTLRSQPNERGLKDFFMALMNMEKDRKQHLLKDIAERIGGLSVTSPAYEWILRLYRENPGDIGSLSPLFLNIVHLQPGEAMHIPSGQLHSYLEGSGLELMANSDNVIRGGLTNKHIDTNELVNILDFKPRLPDILRPERGDALESYYPVKVKEFRLSVITLQDRDSSYKSSSLGSAEIVICTEGGGQLTDVAKEQVMDFHRGVSLFIPAAVEQYLIRGKATVYKASVPF
jgi:mannose-6-phosphate isomerase